MLVGPASLDTEAASVYTTTASCFRSPKKVGQVPNVRHASSEVLTMAAANVKQSANPRQNRPMEPQSMAMDKARIHPSRLPRGRTVGIRKLPVSRRQMTDPMHAC